VGTDEYEHGKPYALSPPGVAAAFAALEEVAQQFDSWAVQQDQLAGDEVTEVDVVLVSPLSLDPWRCRLTDRV
jgi:hypothetical protein